MELPSCSDGQVLKKVSGNWVCSYDKCDVSSSCSQICIGSTCRTSWPSPLQSKTCSGGYYATATSSTTGTVTCTSAYPTVNKCTYGTNGNQWSVGSVCCWGITDYRYRCTPRGWVNTGATCGSWPKC